MRRRGKIAYAAQAEIQKWEWCETEEEAKAIASNWAEKAAIDAALREWGFE
jgi:hypothetical protein